MKKNNKKEQKAAKIIELTDPGHFQNKTVSFVS